MQLENLFEDNVFVYDPKAIYYFGYGSNTNDRQMRERCPNSTFVGVTTLKGYELRFYYFADVAEKRGKSVMGTLWKLTPEDKRELDRREGVSSGHYAIDHLPMMFPDGQMHDALVYVMTSWKRKNNEKKGLCPPSEKYARTVGAGYKMHGIPQSQMTKAPGFKNKLFGIFEDTVQEAFKDEQKEEFVYDPGRGYVLAYGSNTLAAQMKNRCPSAVKLGVVTLRDWELRFYGHATVDPVTGKETKCVLWSISTEDESKLDKKEGVPDSYSKKSAEVMFPDGIRHEALLYVMTNKKKRYYLSEKSARGFNDIKFTPYYDKCWAGYEQNNIPVSQIQEAPGYDSPHAPVPAAPKKTPAAIKPPTITRVDNEEVDESFDILTKEDILNEFEITKQPNKLKNMANKVGAKCGVEYEMLIPWKPADGQIYPSNQPGMMNQMLTNISKEVGRAVGRNIKASLRYHGATRAANHYNIEPDGSLADTGPRPAGSPYQAWQGWEIITPTPPLTMTEVFEDMTKLVAWAKRYGCYTNNTCGLHMSVSVPVPQGKTLRESLNYVKLILLTNDDDILKIFKRDMNPHCKSALGIIKGIVRSNPQAVQTALRALKDDKLKAASNALRRPENISSREMHMESINVKENYVEFRSPGGDYLNAGVEKLQNTMMRFVVSLDAACWPNKRRIIFKELLEALLNKKGAYASMAGEKLPGNVQATELMDSFLEFIADGGYDNDASLEDLTKKLIASGPEGVELLLKSIDDE